LDKLQKKWYAVSMPSAAQQKALKQHTIFFAVYPMQGALTLSLTQSQNAVERSGKGTTFVILP